MANRVVVARVISVALFVIVCLAAGFFVSFLTQSWVWVVVAGVVTGSLVGRVSDATRRKIGGSRREPDMGNDSSDDDPRSRH